MILIRLGEFNECRNITDGNFTGKYVLLAKPFEAMFSNPANGIVSASLKKYQRLLK